HNVCHPGLDAQSSVIVLHSDIRLVLNGASCSGSCNRSLIVRHYIMCPGYNGAPCCNLHGLMPSFQFRPCS
ncbi:MAG: hypothetical protein LBK57_01005, partial [Clostridiales Family XIII bacterium]|nr:hypothetical protein [Clostridiales Family XIII bacterium]